ncbi:zinc finger MYND domain-containing protein 19-like [Watersipora subatra]|uniref:zinc finger MYND domain-containing protein 19-like n=1 Tax=Watersipora subatra TaxID=2589382 RepID=UPI00355BA21C
MHIVQEDRYCLINVGRAAGKIKFCMLDEMYKEVGKEYTLRAALLKGCETRGASVHVLAFPMKETENDDRQVTTIQEIIWKLCHPESAPSFDSLRHINGNSMDNREENLALVNPEEITPFYGQEVTETTQASKIDCRTYSSCVTQLISLTTWTNVPECISSVAGAVCSPLPPSAKLDEYGKLLDSTDGVLTTHECHYLPCTNLERKRLEYDSCGGCLAVRYCSSECQLLDWPFHMQQCQLVQHLVSQSDSCRTLPKLSIQLESDNSQQRLTSQSERNYSLPVTNNIVSHSCAFELDR